MINMEAIPKFDIKSVIKSDIKFDISTKLTTWIGHKSNFTPLLTAVIINHSQKCNFILLGCFN